MWSSLAEAIHYVRALACELFALEEPMNKRDYSAGNRIFNALGTKIILDESFTKLSDLQHLEQTPNNWILTVRISKMEGVIRSLAIAEQAKQLGIPIIVGAQVGETSILTRAALPVANTYRDIVVAKEGAFGTYFFRKRRYREAPHVWFRW